MKRRLAVLLLVVGAPLHGLSGAGKEGLARLDFRQVVKRAKDKVFPAVVFLKCIRQSHEVGRRATREVGGSGVIISPTGEMLSNWHVVHKAVEVRCLLLDGRALHAKVLGSDKDADLALLKLQLPAGSPPVPHATLGDSSRLKEGDFVMAMGAPWGLARSVSIGIVSCTRRFLPGRSEYSLWLQTDASISPGNSGGPLVDTDGEVVAINTLGVRLGGDMGFAIPAATVKQLLPQLRRHGRMVWSWTGLQLQPLRDFNRNIYFDATAGVIVAGTDPESPARRAGILPADRIVKLNGKAVTALTEEALPPLRRTLGLLPKGRLVTVELVRKGKPLTVELTPREKGKVEGEELDCPRWDFTVKTINRFDNPELHFHRRKGVFVFGIKEPGNAGTADLRRMDILLSIDGKKIATLDDVGKIHKASLKSIETKHRVIIAVLRDGLMHQVVLDFSRDYEKE